MMYSDTIRDVATGQLSFLRKLNTKRTAFDVNSHLAREQEFSRADHLVFLYVNYRHF
jgi:hypothetical protein